MKHIEDTTLVEPKLSMVLPFSLTLVLCPLRAHSCRDPNAENEGSSDVGWTVVGWSVSQRYGAVELRIVELVSLLLASLCHHFNNFAYP